MKIINKTRNTILAEEVILANTPSKRMKGLIGRRDFKQGEALIIKPCNSIHTFFMSFPIDVIFVDKKNRIVGLKVDLKPWRLSPIYWQARYVIELASEALLKSPATEGDEISLI